MKEHSRRLKDPRRERFCREYVRDVNATQAAGRAGYSKKTARQQGTRLLSDASVTERIGELQREIEQKIKSDAVQLRINLRLMADVKIDDIFNDDLTIKGFSQMTEGARLVISGIDVRVEKIDGVEVAQLVKIKMESKTKIMELLGKHREVAAWKENTNVVDGDSRVERMRRYQQRIGKRGPKKEEPVDITPIQTELRS